jgi:DNA-binding winged helix-turn-helix (wHTH) protein
MLQNLDPVDFNLNAAPATGQNELPAAGGLLNEKQQCAAYQFGAFTLDAGREALLGADGAELPLRAKTLALLRLLVENAGRTVPKDTIMASVWPGLFVTDNSMTQCVHEIRGALGTGAQHILRTRHRRGYLLDAEVIAIESRPCLLRRV